MAEEKAAEEFVQFLRISANPAVKLTGLEHIKGLTSDAPGIKFIVEHKDILEAVFSLTKDKILEVVDSAYISIINLSADDNAAERIINDYDIITDLTETICNPKSFKSDDACKILNNLTRTKKGSLEFIKKIVKTEENKDFSLKDSKLGKLIDIFCKIKYNEKGCTLDHIASVIANITQTEKGRNLLLNHADAVIGRLLPFLNPDSSSLVRRQGISMTIKNCCFDYEHHEWLLGESIEILPQLLLPLAGGEELTEEENDSLPIDLQYLPEDKKREPDPEIRLALTESLFLLCADKFGRMFLKDSGTSYILRELHLWEQKHGSEKNIEEYEKLIKILDADEPEPGMENLMTIPDEEFQTITLI